MKNRPEFAEHSFSCSAESYRIIPAVRYWLEKQNTALNMQTVEMVTGAVLRSHARFLPGKGYAGTKLVKVRTNLKALRQPSR